MYRLKRQYAGQELPPPPLDAQVISIAPPQRRPTRKHVQRILPSIITSSEWWEYSAAGWRAPHMISEREMTRSKACMHCNGDYTALQALRVDAAVNRFGDVQAAQFYVKSTPATSFRELDDDELFHIHLLFKKTEKQALESANAPQGSANGPQGPAVTSRPTGSIEVRSNGAQRPGPPGGYRATPHSSRAEGSNGNRDIQH
ncbi:hypothetical protein K402DRAFT_395264 [Aulographum hederae CBS 113979]|uniref:Uncharacterized protein n=1 Tax=Aulographum hederae CBS 113979 TaxID=1176131 RepID=A0A6G1GVB5_9PEZI|nr:hypothetical protein K402DRAFT_395264 [Aulographum hederae CBS 113979]